jgi:hypothetical protein
MAPSHVAARFIAPTLTAYRRQSRPGPCSGAILTPTETGIAFRPLAILSTPFQARNACLHPLLGAKLARMEGRGEGRRRAASSQSVASPGALGVVRAKMAVPNNDGSRS